MYKIEFDFIRPETQSRVTCTVFSMLPLDVLRPSVKISGFIIDGLRQEKCDVDLLFDCEHRESFD